MVEEKIEVDEVIEIVEGVHGTHPAYNFYVLKRLQDLLPDVTTPEGIIDPTAARNVLEDTLIPELIPHLAGAENLKIVVNDHFRGLITDNGWLDLYQYYSKDPKLARFIHAIDPFLMR
jgi:hypothetical protein